MIECTTSIMIIQELTDQLHCTSVCNSCYDITNGSNGTPVGCYSV